MYMCVFDLGPKFYIRTHLDRMYIQLQGGVRGYWFLAAEFMDCVWLGFKLVR